MFDSESRIWFRTGQKVYIVVPREVVRGEHFPEKLGSRSDNSAASRNLGGPHVEINTKRWKIGFKCFHLAEQSYA